MRMPPSEVVLGDEPDVIFVCEGEVKFKEGACRILQRVREATPEKTTRARPRGDRSKSGRGTNNPVSGVV